MMDSCFHRNLQAGSSPPQPVKEGKRHDAQRGQEQPAGCDETTGRSARRVEESANHEPLSTKKTVNRFQQKNDIYRPKLLRL
jgi:hypothetical protein